MYSFQHSENITCSLCHKYYYRSRCSDQVRTHSNVFVRDRYVSVREEGKKKTLQRKKKTKKKTRWLFARLPHIKCIRLGSMRSSHHPFKMHYVRSSHVFAPTGE